LKFYVHSPSNYRKGYVGREEEGEWMKSKGAGISGGAKGGAAMEGGGKRKEKGGEVEGRGGRGGR
jgi:hypothetical protein